MHAGNRAIERAEEMVAMERDTAIARIRGTMASAGSELCEDCGDAIEAMRRAAMPSARRCASCQERFELKKRRGW
jgi:phage/conjugal plasmid C-4 type zinc finger TraR family protein